MKIYCFEGFAGGRDESRRLLKKAIAEYTGDTGRAEQLVSVLKTGEHGKPYIEGFDHFSVSHTGSIWAVLFDERECGLDIQLGKDCDTAAISRRFYAPEDADRIAGLADAKDEFFRLWTRREALAKALGVSVYDSGLPAVTPSRVNVSNRSYLIEDIRLPGLPEIFAAVCREAGDPSN